MAEYLFFVMDERAGHVVRVRNFKAPDDGVAVALADDARGQWPTELWSGGRKIKRWEVSPVQGAR